MLNLKLVTKPAVSPVTLSQLKANLRKEDDAEDEFLQELLDAAVEQLDGRYGDLQRAVINQTYEWRLKCFPCARSELRLPLPPLQSITSIKYMDSSELEQLIDPSDYEVCPDEYIGAVRLKNGANWPRDLLNESWPITVEFIAGFGAVASDVPLRLRRAIIYLASHWYEFRLPVESCTLNEVPNTFKALINPYRMRSL